MKLTLGWLYPELMSTYGDRGNCLIFQKRCQWRNIDVTVLPIDFQTTLKQIKECSIIFGGGAQDRQQSLVITDLRDRKGEILKQLFTDGTPGLFVCGAPQLLGHSYVDGEGNTLKGLGIFDMETKHPGKTKSRCIGTMVAELDSELYQEVQNAYTNSELRRTIVGFENHGGRTFLGDTIQPLATIIRGSGNNGQDQTEGAIYRHCLATYSHGPFLSKNPHLADWLIWKALHKQYGEIVPLKPLDDMLIWKAHEVILKRQT
jgi:CobQ-like glutamine amidotransferase family enzyme